MENQTLLMLLIAGGLVVYGILHGSLNIWVWRNREQFIIPHLLFMSPVGVGGVVLACVPFIGWQAALTVIIALAVAFMPVMLIVGWAIFNQEDGLQ